MTRTLSYTEITTALTCQARWDFGYGGRLAGSALASRTIAPILREGRAWGAAVAAYHAAGDLLAVWSGHQAIHESLWADAAEMAAAGVPNDLEEMVEMERRLGALFDHYVQVGQALVNLTRLEGEIDVPIPSRHGSRASTRYRFMCLLDGFTIDVDGHQWLVEFKLRRELTPVQFIQMSPQHRWYAWARQRESGQKVIGVLIDERLNAEPKPPRVLKSGKVSQDKAQITTPELYRQACAATDTAVDEDLAVAFGERRWQQVVPLIFRDGELDDAGAELVSAAKLIRDLDSGELAPIRNASKMLCSGCRFRQICPNPADELFVESLFSRVPAKRDRDLVAA